MRYAYHDLGYQHEGNKVVVRWRGAGGDALLLDPVNFSKYCGGRRPVFYSAGGRYARPPAELTIPEDGRWYVVADLHSNSAHPRATVEVLSKDAGDQEPHEKRLAEVG